MTLPDNASQEKQPLFSGPIIPILYLRLVESLSVEHQGNPTAIERALHKLGKSMATPLLLGLVKRYGRPSEAFFPTSADTFLNRVDEYLSRNWELATGSTPNSLEFSDDRTLLLRTDSCPICQHDTFDVNFDLRYCEFVSGMLEGILQQWIESLKLSYAARVTQTASRIQGEKICEFRINFTDKSV